MAPARLCNSNGWFAPSQAHYRLGRVEIGSVSSDSGSSGSGSNMRRDLTGFWDLPAFCDLPGFYDLPGFWDLPGSVVYNLLGFRL
ncbi:hypothetical protein SLEP1_g32990 [Rubroshorea leprosula]|uniref:Uncharacterized protein n=1 Tax=Rubroshorea leprosula TaxID=152421 RepID=A0AAV5KFB1_9ROSI|nr:hypothetical protein SLEP1_g32990 [Rubroshorea leprosula]